MIYLLTKRLLKLTTAWKAGSHNKDCGDQGTKRKHTLSACCYCSITNSCPNSFVTPWSLPGSSDYWLSQARIFEWVNISSFRGSSQTRDWTQLSWVGRQILYHWATREAQLPSKSNWKRFWWIRLQEHQGVLNFPSAMWDDNRVAWVRPRVLIRVRINVITSF